MLTVEEYANGLKISELLTLPFEAVTWVNSFLAKRGAGKTYCASVLAEEMMKKQIPIVVIDGMGIWWGLRVSSDGLHEGLPIVVFGGEHADLPLVPEKAADLARAIVESNISCVLDLSGFSKSISRKIVREFLNELYRLNRVDRHVFIEEADMFGMQRPIGPEEALCLSAVDNFVRRGGNHNLGCTLITQRSAVLNKDILTQSDCLVILRTLAPQDKKAIQAWVEEQTDKEKKGLNEWYDSLKSLANGEAWVWHPENPDIFEKVQFRHRETFHATREFIKSPRASSIVLMDVAEFIAKFKSRFELTKPAIEAKKSEEAAFSACERDDMNEEIKKLHVWLDAANSRINTLVKESKDYRNQVEKEMADKLKTLDTISQELEELRPMKPFRDSLRQLIGPVTVDARTTDAQAELAISVQPTLTEFTVHKAKREVLEATDQDTDGQILLLAHDGWFGERRKITAVRAELERRFNSRPRPGTVETVMGNLVGKGVLTREKEANSWTYWLSEGAEKLIKASGA